MTTTSSPARGPRPSAAARANRARSCARVARAAGERAEHRPRTRPRGSDAGRRAVGPGGRDERRSAARGVTWARRIDPAARTAASKLESGGSPASPAGSQSRSDDDRLARRVLELLHHQLAPPRRRRPVHAPQRLALLVLAHRVEVEAGRPPQEEPPALPGEAGPCRRRAPRASTSRGCTSALTGRRRADSETDSSPSGSRSSILASAISKRPRGSAPSSSVSRQPAARGSAGGTRTLPSRPSRPRRRQSRAGSRDARGRVDPQRDLVALGRRVRAASRPRRRPGRVRATAQTRVRPAPRAGGRAPATPSGRDAEDDRGCEHDPAEDQCSAATHHTGTGVSSSARRTASAASAPAVLASGATISRCASTATATLWTSSGSTKSRPRATARAFAMRRSAIPARGLAPSASCGLVARVLQERHDVAVDALLDEHAACGVDGGEDVLARRDRLRGRRAAGRSSAPRASAPPRRAADSRARAAP